ncbi:unnamed protein product [Paramecium octaurelia]|uniref:Uncharacterized protein n=1 Tax=Paramecium octaurelia TaxID=43137 RepID=A0A8S1Y550_PAROT|nr:unnamed protein product [Paramecium octaurelia]
MQKQLFQRVQSKSMKVENMKINDQSLIMLNNYTIIYFQYQRHLLIKDFYFHLKVQKNSQLIQQQYLLDKHPELLNNIPQRYKFGVFCTQFE